MKIKTHYSKYMMGALMAIVVSGCVKTSDFVLLPDREGIDAQIWENQGAVQFLLNETYDMIMPRFPYDFTGNNFNIHLVSDENYFSAKDNWGKRVFNFNGALTANDVRYVGAKYQGNNFGDNRYFDVANCNLAITNLPNSEAIPELARRGMLGQFYCLRAMLYFNLTKYYGGVPLVLEPQDPSNLNLAGRVSAGKMFEQIVKDFDSAMVNLEGIAWSAEERGKLSHAAAAALKAKALLYWASPQFNPVGDPAHPHDPQRWQVAHQAAKEAYDICLAAGYDLMDDYGSIFQIEGAGNKEAIVVKSYSPNHPKRSHNVEARCRPASENGSPSDVYWASTRMIDAYTMKDGVPITGNLDYDPVLFWMNRDPRFEATIAYNGSYWKLSGENNRRQWTYMDAEGESGNRGFYCKRFASPDLPYGSVDYEDDYGGSGMDWIELRFAEVMLNYAETANEVDDLNLAKQLVRQIRMRAGIEAGAFDYGLALATNKEQMRDLIMNERMVEFAFEGKRGDDLRRTRRMHQLTGTLGAMQFEVIADSLQARLEMVIDPATGMRYRETLDMTNKDTVLAYFQYPYEVLIPDNNGPFSMPEHYYFFALQNAFMNSSPLLEQTIGWDAGTFDPLK